jgi:hypothetical protein
MTRSFSRFSQAIEEVVDARVWSGIHFRTADEQGEVIGRDVAKWRYKHYLQPVRRQPASKDTEAPTFGNPRGMPLTDPPGAGPCARRTYDATDLDQPHHLILGRRRPRVAANPSSSPARKYFFTVSRATPLARVIERCDLPLCQRRTTSTISIRLSSDNPSRSPRGGGHGDEPSRGWPLSFVVITWP